MTKQTKTALLELLGGVIIGLVLVSACVYLADYSEIEERVTYPWER